MLGPDFIKNGRIFKIDPMVTTELFVQGLATDTVFIGSAFKNDHFNAQLNTLEDDYITALII